MASVTAIILTKNEELNIVDCLKSVQGFARRAVVVDCGSTDRTIELAEANGAEVLHHDFENYARQFNWALDNAGIDTDWVLRLDADERLTHEVIRESTAAIEKAEEPGSDINGIVMEATFYMLGRPLKHGITAKRKLMLFKFGIGRIEDRRMDEHTVLSTGRAVNIKSRFIHYDFKSVDHFVRKLNWYATREAMDVAVGQNTDISSVTDPHIRRTRRLKGGLYYRFPKFFRSWLLFIYYYFFRLGFLDGREGLIYIFMYAHMYRFIVDAKLYEYEKTGSGLYETGALD